MRVPANFPEGRVERVEEVVDVVVREHPETQQDVGP